MGTREKFRKWTEIGYIIGLVLFLAYRAFDNTMIRKDFGFTRFKPAEMCWMVFMLLLIVVRTVSVRCYSRWELVIAVVFCLLCFLSWWHARVYWFIMMPLLVVGAKGIPFDRIVKTFLITVGGMIGTAVVLAFAGVITNLEYTRYVTDPSSPDGVIAVPRFAYGTTYPTTFSEFVFFLCAAWLYIRRKRIRFYDVILLGAVAVFLYKGPNAVTDAVCVGTLAILAVGAILWKYLSKSVTAVIHKLCITLVFVTAVCAAVMTGLMIGYDASRPFWTTLDTRLHLRLSLGDYGLQTYGIHLFGSMVKYRATGGNVDLVTRPDYFNLDCSYHLILINFGIIILLCIVGFYTAASLRAWQKKDLLLLLVIVVISLECVMENRLIQPQYNIFLILFFADIRTEGGLWYCIFGPCRREDEADAAQLADCGRDEGTAGQAADRGRDEGTAGEAADRRRDEGTAGQAAEQAEGKGRSRRSVRIEEISL